MANPTPNAFVSAYTNYRIKLVEGTPPWIVETRITKRIIGHIKKVKDEYCFVPYPGALTNITHIQLLDLAAAVKTVEKREAAPHLYK
jgi:hypothetical protein